MIVVTAGVAMIAGGIVVNVILMRRAQGHRSALGRWLARFGRNFIS